MCPFVITEKTQSCQLLLKLSFVNIHFHMWDNLVLLLCLNELKTVS